MKCVDPAIGKLISLYEFGQLTEEERKAFEVHLLNCDFCFQSLYEMSPVVELMRDNPESFLQALSVEKGVPVGAKVKGVWDSLRFHLTEAFAPIPKPVWVAASVVAVAVLLLISVLTRQPDKYSELARIEPVQYVALAMRAGESPSESEKLFKQGMEFYAAGKYPEAVGKLSLAVAKEPKNVEAHFYLGLCYLFSQAVDSAIVHLEKAIELGDNFLAEKCHWYLGNAFLLKEEPEKALAEFRKVLEFEGDYWFKAQRMIAEIGKIRKQS